MIICAGEMESFHFAKPMGIGLMDTAINLTQFCISNSPKSLLFVGSAGSYGRYEIFDIVHSEIASNIENSLFNANAYTPIDTKVRALSVSQETVVNSSNYITTDFNLAKRYLEEGIDLENMEFYAVLKVAERFNIKASGIFVVTNYCNSNAHGDFLKNHGESMQILTKYVIEREIINFP